jgi:hypothetical protein
MKLQNGIVSFDFCETDGSLTQITDLRTGWNCLSASISHRLVKLIQFTPEKSSNILLSNEAGAPGMAIDGDALTIRFPPLRDGAVDSGIYLTVSVRLPEASEEALFSLTIKNGGDFPVVEAWFPFIAGRRGAPDGCGDIFTTSHGRVEDLYGRFDHGTNDTHAFGQHHQRIGISAVSLLPMMDLTADAGGLSYIKYEEKPRPTDFVYENLTGDPKKVELGWAWVNTILLKPGGTWRSGEFGVGVHRGDWHETADRLRRFMESWWVPTNYPSSLREKIGLYHVQIKGFNGEPYHDFDELPEMARDCVKFGISDLMFWDYTTSVYSRPDAAGDYWEMSPERKEMLKRSLAEVKETGFQVSACVNYRLINATSRAWERIGSEEQSSFFGMPLYGNAAGSMNGGIYLNRFYEQGTRSLCQGTEKFAEFARELSEETLDIGLNSLFVDQACEWCYAVPRGREDLDPFEVMDRAYEWFGKSTAMARDRDPEAYSIGEMPDMWNTQGVDVWWIWGWGCQFPPEVFLYLMPEMCLLWCIDEFQQSVLAKAFAMGSFLAIATRGMTGLISDEPAFAERITRLGKLRKRTAAFVSHGRFVDNRGLSVKGGDGFVFLSNAGAAVTLANGAGEETELNINFAAEEIFGGRLEPGTIYFEDGSTAVAEPEASEGVLRLRVGLGAREAAIWTMPRAI